MKTRLVMSTGLHKVMSVATVAIIFGIFFFLEGILLQKGRVSAAVISGLLCLVAFAFMVALYSTFTTLVKLKNVAISNLAAGNLVTDGTDGGTVIDTPNEIVTIRKKVSEVILQIIAGKTTLDAVADELTIIADDTMSGSEKLRSESHSLAAASEQLSVNVMTMATAAEELSTTSGTVAASIEELSSSIREVANNSENGARIGRNVSSMAKDAEEIMSKMGNDTRQISSVVDVIQQIADQTNLLALNATIEAASAGDAGKGFSVVATEVKDLARQSLKASEEITQQVEQVQKNTQKAIATIQEVFTLIDELSIATNTIAVAVEEQSSTTSEVARSITNVSNATDELARNIQETSVASGEVAKRTTVLENLSRQTALISSQTRIGVESINDVRERLKNSMQSFTTGDKKFDIATIKGAHMVWVERLQSVLRGDLVLKPEEVTVHTACDFGKWLYSDAGKKLASDPAYANVDTYHKQVHNYAREVVYLYGNKMYEDAQKKMGEFEKARNKLFSYLNELYCS